jgi:hypothetical protein
MNMDLLNGVVKWTSKKRLTVLTIIIILFQKMYCYGIRGHTLAWFQSYLLAGFKYARYCRSNNVQKQEFLNVEYPKVLILGHFGSYYIKYINTLPNCLTSFSASKFADDTNISINGKTIDELQDA